MSGLVYPREVRQLERDIIGKSSLRLITEFAMQKIFGFKTDHADSVDNRTRIFNDGSVYAR